MTSRANSKEIISLESFLKYVIIYVMKNISKNVLIVEDDELTRLGLCQLLKNTGKCFEAQNRNQAVEILSKQKIDLAFIDLHLEKNESGLPLVRAFSEKGIYTVVLSGHENDEIIKNAYKEGCQDYLVKPLRKESLKKLLSKFDLLKGRQILEDFFSKKYLTNDSETKRRLDVLSEVLISDRPVLLQGETGTGKTLIAKLIHELRFETEDNFIAFNCAEIPENLLESELFGFVKGAFSGANHDKKGKLMLAHEGTLFLDEVATLPLNLQQKLLKAIEEKSFYPLGSEKKVFSDFHLISATSENLKKLVDEGSFKKDLYFRIEGFNIELPPLRERKEDIELLINYFLKNINLLGRRVILEPEVRMALLNYSWPGNIRELQKTIQIFLASSKGIITQECLPECFHLKGIASQDHEAKHKRHELILKEGLKSYIEKVEEDILLEFFKKNSSQVRMTLKELQLSNNSFYRILGRLKSKGLIRD